MGWETARGISALVSLLLPFNLLLLAKSTWKPKAAGARSSLPGHRAKAGGRGHVDCGSGGREGEFLAHSVFLFLTQTRLVSFV